MKATLKLFTTDGVDRNNLYPIKLILHHNKKVKRKTIAKSNLKDWDEKNNLPLYSHSDFDDLYDQINLIKKRSNSIEFRNITDLNVALKYLIKKKDSGLINFYDYADQRISYMKSIGRNGNADSYQHAINELKSFKYSLYYSDINKSFINGFIEFKKQQTKSNGERLKNTTIRAYVSAIKAIYNKCAFQNDLKNNNPFLNCFADLKISKRPRNVYLNIYGIKKLENASFKQPSFQRCLDLNLLQFYFCGVDFTDMYHLKKSQINKGRVFLKRSKLGEKAYEFDFKILDKARIIIDKYKSDEKEYLFPWRKDRTGYKTFIDNHRRDTKLIFKILEMEVLPKPESFTTKSMRHTFATIAKFKHIDPDIIRELMGHERTDIDTVYKDTYPEAVRDEAQFEIINTNGIKNPLD